MVLVCALTRSVLFLTCNVLFSTSGVGGTTNLRPILVSSNGFLILLNAANLKFNAINSLLNHIFELPCNYIYDSHVQNYRKNLSNSLTTQMQKKIAKTL